MKVSIDASREFEEELQDLLQTDNFTNAFYVLRVWLILGITIGGFILFDLWRAQAGLSPFLDLPPLLLVILIVGASQHQLAGAGHEGTHYTLFRNRSWNRFASNWFCMFPILTSTEIYRKQHLAHHRHVNDPQEDPDLAQLESSGHGFVFPCERKEVLRLFLRQMLPHHLARYTFQRAKYSAVGIGGEDRVPTPLATRLFFPYAFGLLALQGLLAHLEVSGFTMVLASSFLILAGTIVLLLSRRFGARPGKDEASSTWQRYLHITLLISFLTATHMITGLETLTYFAVLWLLPLGTTFSYFMMLRQVIQHANCDRGRFSNTRVFHVNPLLRYAIFPFGMDYHLPHHLYATVPHYHLARLHELLRNVPGYEHRGSVVEGCFSLSDRNAAGPRNPGIVEALGKDYSPGEEVESV